MLNFVEQNGIGLQNWISDVISTNSVDVNKSTDKMLIQGRNVMQTNLVHLKNFQAHEFHDLNMFFTVWALPLVDLTMASDSYVHRYLCKNIQGSSWLRNLGRTDFSLQEK